MKKYIFRQLLVACLCFFPFISKGQTPNSNSFAQLQTGEPTLFLQNVYSRSISTDIADIGIFTLTRNPEEKSALLIS